LKREQGINALEQRIPFEQWITRFQAHLLSQLGVNPPRAVHDTGELSGRLSRTRPELLFPARVGQVLRRHTASGPTGKRRVVRPEPANELESSNSFHPPASLTRFEDSPGESQTPRAVPMRTTHLVQAALRTRVLPLAIRWVRVEQVGGRDRAERDAQQSVGRAPSRSALLFRCSALLATFPDCQLDRLRNAEQLRIDIRCGHCIASFRLSEPGRHAALNPAFSCG